MGITASQVVRTLRTKLINTTAAAVLIISGVGFATPLLATQSASAAGATITVCGSCTHTTIQSAVTAAATGDTVDVQDPQVLGAPVTINKQLTITSSTSATVTTAASSAFVLTATGTTIQNLNFVTGNSTTNLIAIQAANASILNNHFAGDYFLGDSEVTRGLAVSPGVANMNVSGNTFQSIRQAAYIDNGVSGTFANNFVGGTRGIVVGSNSNVIFTGNTWGTDANRNAVDIAVINANAAPAPAGPNNYDAATLAANNSGAVVNDQVTNGLAGQTFTTVYVNASALAGGDGTWLKPFNTLQAGINATNSGGTVNVAAGTYTANQYLVSSGKEITIKGAGAGTTFMQLSAVSDGFKVQANNVTLEDFTINTTGVANYGLRAQGVSNLTVNNVNVIGMVKSGFDFNGVTNSQFSNLFALNNGGNGISITDSRDLTFNNTTTNGNAWGGIAMYAKGVAYPCGVNNIVFNGSTNIGEVRALYSGIDSPTNPACTVTNVAVPASLTYRVTLDRFDPQTIYVKSAEDAAIIAAQFSSDSPVITNLYPTPPTPPAGGGSGSTGGTGSTGSTGAAATPATTTYIAYYDGNGDAVAYDDGTVTTTDENTTDEGEVKGSSTNKGNSAKDDTSKNDESENTSAFLGLGWWWIPIILVGLGIIYWVVVKRADTTSSSS